MADHKVANCEGVWINVGTLSDPDMELCAACRATRRATPEPPDFPPAATIAGPQETTQEMRSPTFPYLRTVGYGIAFLLGVLLGWLAVS